MATADTKFWLALVCMPTLSFIGVITNALNQATFISQGLREHVTFTLYCLSLTDFLVALTTLGFAFSYTGRLYPPDDVDSAVANVAFAWLRVMFSDIAVGITVFISIERSCCVAFPFAFSLMFNVTKSRIVVLSIAAFVVANYVPVFTAICVFRYTDPATNASYAYGCASAPYAGIVYRHIGITFGTSLSLICEVSTFVGVVVMHVCLLRSSQLRFLMQSSSSSGSSEPRRKSGKVTSATMSRKEERAVRMVLVVAVIYLVTSVPKVAFNLSLALVPDLMGYTYLNVSSTIGYISYVTGTVNGCFHLFVFYKYNSAFRRSFRKIMFIPDA
ncbi:hypothetical protein Btru_023398 [Bulinus truncatus]|nr:hypothetical protein Btru_023398 [Bulinus truncatus]